MARGLGINVDALFAITFALGSGLAGLGGALAIEIIGLDPSFALTYLIYVLIVVSVGALGSIEGSFAAAVVLGISDVAGKYYIPHLGPSLAYLQAQTRWRPVEIIFWLATLLPYVLFPNYLSLASQIAITALFALSLDLILGYAGIVSLGHAAYFGVGAYAAGLVSKHGWGEPLTGLAIAALAAGIVGYATSFVICRFRHLALIMLTTG